MPCYATSASFNAFSYQPPSFLSQQTSSSYGLNNYMQGYEAGQAAAQYQAQQAATTAAAAARSASDGCDDENNDRITPELALCSVHAYNIGEQENPSGADKQLMRDVVALKTTVITQQMNKQYEYMDAMIRRFKTQLEKAILTTKLQAAGAGTNNPNTASASGAYSGGSYTSGANKERITNVYLAGAENCASKLDTLEMINCLGNNYAIITEATNTGQTVSSEARKQLATDFKLLINTGLIVDTSKQPRNSNGYNNKCESDRSMAQRTGMQECLTAHSANLRAAKDEYNRNNRNNQSYNR